MRSVSEGYDAYSFCSVSYNPEHVDRIFGCSVGIDFLFLPRNLFQWNEQFHRFSKCEIKTEYSFCNTEKIINLLYKLRSSIIFK